MTKDKSSIDLLFYKAPIIQDVAIEFGIKDTNTIRALYELFKRASGLEDQPDIQTKEYEDGYKDGWNDALDEVESRLDFIRK